MTDTQIILEILDTMDESLKPEGWGKGRAQTGTGAPWCMGGHLDSAFDKTLTCQPLVRSQGLYKAPLYKTVYDLLVGTIDELFPSPDPTWPQRSIIYFNDDPRITLDDVRAVVQKTRAKVEEMV